jgi:site-specific DNA recombinase
VYGIVADVKIGIYLRMSQDRTGEELGLARQREDCRALTQVRGWDAVREYPDNDVSAAGGKRRPRFEELLADVEAGVIEGVVAWSMDRLMRNSRDRIRLLELGKTRGLMVALVRGNDLNLSTPAGRLTADILGAVAQSEVEIKSDRQRRASAQAAAAGRRVGGRRPFGFEPDGITLRPAEAAALRHGYDQILHGVPVAAVARSLNDAGLHTPQLSRRWQHGPECLCPQPGDLDSAEECPDRTKVSRWAGQTLRVTLQNPRYAGIRAVSRGTGRWKEWEHIAPAVWPAIVDEDVWRAVQGVLGDPARSSPGRNGQRLLTGTARCGVCGSTVQAGGTSRAASDLGYYTYRCKASAGHIARRGDVVDEYVSAVVVGRLSRPDAADLLLDHDRPDAGELQSRAQALRLRLDGLASLYSEGVLSAEGVRTESARLRESLATVEAAMADAGRAPVLAPLVTAEDVQVAWDELGTDRQRMVIDLLMEIRLQPPGRGKRAFDPATVEITWRG